MAFAPLKAIGGFAKGVTNLFNKRKAKKTAKLAAREEKIQNQKEELAAIGLPDGMLAGGLSDVVAQSSVAIFGTSESGAIDKAASQGTITQTGFDFSKYLLPVVGLLLLVVGFFMFKKKRR